VVQEESRLSEFLQHTANLRSLTIDIGSDVEFYRLFHSLTFPQLVSLTLGGKLSMDVDGGLSGWFGPGDLMLRSLNLLKPKRAGLANKGITYDYGIKT
jgi:hypothetical protein